MVIVSYGRLTLGGRDVRLYGLVRLFEKTCRASPLASALGNLRGEGHGVLAWCCTGRDARGLGYGVVGRSRALRALAPAALKPQVEVDENMFQIPADGVTEPHTNGVEFREFVQWFTFHVNLFQVVEASSLRA